MRIRNVDKNWDWTFGQGQSNYTRDLNACILDIKMQIKEWYEDCYFNLIKGIPWRERLGSKSQKELLDNDIITIAQRVEGVLNVFNFTSSISNRKYTCQFEIYTIYLPETTTLTLEYEV